MDIFQIDDAGRLFISPAIDDWNVVAQRDIDVVIDLEGGLDLCIPTTANRCLYVYFSFRRRRSATPGCDEASRHRQARSVADR